MRELRLRGAPAVSQQAITGWWHLQGLILLELFGHLEPVLGDAGALYDFEARALVKRTGMQPAS